MTDGRPFRAKAALRRLRAIVALRGAKSQTAETALRRRAPTPPSFAHGRVLRQNGTRRYDTRSRTAANRACCSEFR